MRIALSFLLALATVSANAGSIKGVVKYTGKVKKQKQIKMNADPGCVKANGGKKVFSERTAVDKSGGLQWALVYVKNAKATKPPTTPVTLDQDGCMYKPHVVGVQAKQPIKIINSDALLHNVHSMAKKNKKDNFNMGMAVKGQTLTKSFKKPEVAIKVKCDVHGWMTSYVGVFNHPYFAVTNDKGEFNISGVPDGDYVVEAWHEKYKTSETNVKVAGDTQVTLEFGKKTS